MARINKPVQAVPVFTHEGAPAKRIRADFELRRSVMASLLWESQFYEDGVEIAQRIASLVPQVDAQKVAEMAIEAREKMKLRHMPLFMVRQMAKVDSHKSLVRPTLARVIQRADELAEFLAIYWADKKQPLSAQVKKGLAEAFTKFDEYALGKYNRDNAIKLRDVLFLTHAKPKDKLQEELWKKLVDNTLATPDTWEVELSASTDKKASWTRLLIEKKLFALALLRNLRNMEQAGVGESLIRQALAEIKTERVLPYRFIAAARYAPKYEPELEQAMFKCVADHEKLAGKTVLLIDVSGSMDAPLSDKSDLRRLDAACGVAMLAREICESVDVFSFSNETRVVPARRGFALRDAIVQSQSHQGTYLGAAVKRVNQDEYDRLIVITDEQSHDAVGDPQGKGYIINVASYRNGVGYGKWTHIDGWSEAVIDYIQQYENLK